MNKEGLLKEIKKNVTINSKHLRVALVYLKLLRGDVRKYIHDSDAGLCRQIEIELRRNNVERYDALLFEICLFSYADLSKWKYYSGRCSYPVAGGESSYNHHRTKKTLWLGHQLGMRLELIDILVSEIESILKFERAEDEPRLHLESLRIDKQRG